MGLKNFNLKHFGQGYKDEIDFYAEFDFRDHPSGKCVRRLWTEFPCAPHPHCGDISTRWLCGPACKGAWREAHCVHGATDRRR